MRGENPSTRPPSPTIIESAMRTLKYACRVGPRVKSQSTAASRDSTSITCALSCAEIRNVLVSRAASRPRLDAPGVAASSAALTGVTYGFIRAGEAGWTDAVALSAMAAGVVLLALFVWWERRAASRGGQPLVDLPLFRVTGFRWGTILMTLVTFAMFGLMFTVPLYFQDIRGATPLGSGVRMLPLVGGMLVGMAAAIAIALISYDWKIIELQAMSISNAYGAYGDFLAGLGMSL